MPNNELEWLDRRIATLPFARVRELQLRYPKGERLDLYRDDAGQPNLQVRQLPSGRKLAYEAAANGAAALFADLRFADVAPLAQVGFRQAPLLLAFSLRTFSGARLDGEIRRQGEQYWLLPKSVEGFAEGEVAAHPDWAYRIEEDRYRALARHLPELLAR